MKCRYVFRVQSNLRLGPSIQFNFEGRDFTFLADKDGRLNSVQVEINCYPRELWPSFRADGELPTVNIPFDPHFIAITETLKRARSALALWAVQDIDLDFPELHWLPENSEETRQLQISDFNLQRRSGPLPLVPGPADMLVRCVLSAPEFAKYEIPLDFYRRSLDDMRRTRYVEAFYDLWFVLEYLFGGGVYSKNGIGRSFRTSHELLRALGEVRKTWGEPLTRREDVWQLVQSKYMEKRDEQIITELVELRGFLHHQSFKRRINWNPMDQAEYKSDAVFLRYLCQHVLMKAACDILFEPEIMARFLSTKVTDASGRIISWQPFPKT